MERRDPRQGATLRDWFRYHVLTTFAGRILSLDETVALPSARLHVSDRQPIRDAFIAATAWAHGMTVVTRNVVDFKPLGVAVFNPWQE